MFRENRVLYLDIFRKIKMFFRRRAFAARICICLLPAGFMMLVLPSVVFPGNTEITGAWHYRLLIDDVPVGGLYIERKKDRKEYLTSTEMTVTGGGTVTVIRNFHREKFDFTPVRTTSVMTAVSGENTVSRRIVTADFSGGKVVITEGKNRTEYFFDEKFFISGNVILKKFLTRGMKQGLREKVRFYSPETDPSGLTDLETEIIGIEPVSVRGKTLDLIHSVWMTGADRRTDDYSDAKGVLIKSVSIVSGKIYVLEKLK